MAQFVWQSSITLSNYLLYNPQIVRGKNVIELGAGSGLPSLVTNLLSTESVVCTDYPEQSILLNLKRNLSQNFVADACTSFDIRGWKWGEHILRKNSLSSFDIILMADTLWIEREHHNLIKSLKDCCSKSSTIICSYMHHDEDGSIAKGFFEKCVEQGFEIFDRLQFQWKNVDVNELKPYSANPLENVDSDNETLPGEYGPVFIYFLRLSSSS